MFPFPAGKKGTLLDSGVPESLLSALDVSVPFLTQGNEIKGELTRVLSRGGTQ